MPASLRPSRAPTWRVPGALALIAFAAASPARALDPGEDGVRVFFAPTSTADAAHAGVLDPQGRLTLAGMGGSTSRIALARIDANGAPDASLGGTGLVVGTLGSVGVVGLRALARMDDGRLVACGETSRSGTGNDFLVARFNVDGSLDASFNGSGFVATAFAGTVGATLFDRCNAVAVLADGSVLAAGSTAQNSGWNNVALLRYTPAGALDASFGQGGRVIVNAAANASSDNDARALAVQADGRILIAGGASGSGNNPDLLVMRFLANGTPDATFGAGGRVLTSIGIDDAANALAIQPDGRIVVAGSAIPPGSSSRDVVVARYNANGVLDATFGTGGVKTLPFGPADDIAYAIAVMPWGRLVVAGSARLSASASGTALAVAALEPNGSLDRSFGIDGQRMLALGGVTAVGRAIATDLVRARLWIAGFGDPAMTGDDLMAIEFGLPDTLLRTGFDAAGTH